MEKSPNQTLFFSGDPRYGWRDVAASTLAMKTRHPLLASEGDDESELFGFDAVTQAVMQSVLVPSTQPVCDPELTGPI